MEIADGKNFGSLGKVGADLGPDLHPAVEGGAKKRKDCFRHALVFQAKIGLDQPGMAAEPFFEALRCLDDIHFVRWATIELASRKVNEPHAADTRLAVQSRGERAHCQLAK